MVDRSIREREICEGTLVAADKLYDRTRFKPTKSTRPLMDNVQINVSFRIPLLAQTRGQPLGAVSFDM